MDTLVINIGQLLTLSGPDRPRAGREMSSIGLIRDGAVLISQGKVAAAGFKDLVMNDSRAGSARLVDAGRRVVLPGFVDSHAHPVFARPRLDDFEARLKGASYEDIAKNGGGILSTVDRVRGATESDLAAGLRVWASRFLECGTTTLEAKSGYGLDLDSELKILRAIRAVARAGPLELVPTFLGAHAVPAEFGGRKDEYLRRVCEEMLPAVAKEGLARFADVFCAQGYFEVEEARRVLQAASKAGLGLKLHAEQLSRTGATMLGKDLGAVSVDHLDCVQADDISVLSGSGIVACLVPGANYFLGKPYPPARLLIDGGAAVALATDFNPGTCPCWDMRLILSIACTQMRMTPAEAVAAATINGAHALGLGATHGSLEPGKRADLVCWEAEDYREIPYYFGQTGAAWVMKSGGIVHNQEAALL